jgi:YebC/PmpR family DNA-binding regulatory protein
MGKGWKNPIKAENAAKKGQIFTKVAREVQVAARMGGPDPASNARLALAIKAAQKVSCPKDTIERAIKKGSGQVEGGTIDETLYEGFGPHQVGVLVECQTDNRNRSVTEIRVLFNKHDGSMGSEGSVQWMFERVALVEAAKAGVADPEEDAIETGANDVEHDEGDRYLFYASPTDLDNLRKGLLARGWDVQKAELSFRPKSKTELNDEQRREVVEFLEALEDHDDTHRVHASL